MKKLLCLLLCVPLLAWSAPAPKPEPVTLDLQQVGLRDLVSLVYGHILQANYVIDGTVEQALKPVTLQLKNVEPVAVEGVVRDLLASQGVAVEHKAGVYVVHNKDEIPIDREPWVYRPQYRKAQYLKDLLSGMFPQEVFAQRATGTNIGAVAGIGHGTSTARSSLAGQVATVDQGLNRQLETDADVLIFNVTGMEQFKLENLLATLDVPPGEVMVKAMIYEVQTTKKTGSAIDLALSILNQKLGIELSGGATAAASNVFLKFTSSGLNIAAAFTALSSDSRFKSMANPHVRVRSGASAHFSVGDETPVLGSVSYENDGQAVQSVDYKSSGVIFDVKPIVRPGAIDMQIGQTISSFVQTTTGVNNTPTLNKREVTTELSLKNGEVVVIGGLESSRDNNAESGLSFLPKFLSSDSEDHAKTEIVLMLQAERI